MNTINPLSNSIYNLLVEEPVISPAFDSTDSFADILTEAFNTTIATDTRDKVTNVELLAGQSDDMSGMLLDARKSEIALNLALQIRTKVLDAYNEVMRMSL